MPNRSFLVARRRNERLRSGDQWLLRLADAGVPVARAQFVDAEPSVRMEEARDGLIELARREGRLRRLENVTPGRADAVWDEHLMALGTTVICHLPHHPDVDLLMPSEDLAGCGMRLLMLDGDAVMVTSSAMTGGMALDRYADGAHQQVDVDVWG